MTENQSSPVSSAELPVVEGNHNVPNANEPLQSMTPVSGTEAADVRQVTADPKALPMNRAERRAAARREGKKGYSKKLGTRLNYQQVVNVNQKRNKAWDDCNQLKAAVNVILQACTAVMPYMRSEEIRAHVVDAPYLSRIALAMIEEARGLYARAIANAKRHEGLSGGAATMDDTFTAYEIYNEYMMILECYDAGASRLYEMVTEQLQLAVAQYKEAVGDEASKPVVNALNHSVHSMFNVRKQVDVAVQETRAEIEAPAEQEVAA